MSVYKVVQFLRFWGRIWTYHNRLEGSRTKIYCNFGWRRLVDVTHPGRTFSPYPRLLQWIDRKIIERLFELTNINALVIPYQHWVYRKCYEQARQMLPSITTTVTRPDLLEKK